MLHDDQRKNVSDATLEKQLMALANFRLKAQYSTTYRIFTAIKTPLANPSMQ
jgi:hypothetical protein